MGQFMKKINIFYVVISDLKNSKKGQNKIINQFYESNSSNSSYCGFESIILHDKQNTVRDKALVKHFYSVNIKQQIKKKKDTNKHIQALKIPVDESIVVCDVAKAVDGLARTNSLKNNLK